MKTTTTTTTYADIAEAFAIYERDVSAVLANLDRTSPAPLIRQLQNARRADEVARSNPATAETIAEAEARHAEAREAIAEADRIAHRITAAEADRIAAIQEGATERAEADEARATAADLAKVIARTLSDRADLVQVSAAADLEEPTETEIAAAERTAEEAGGDWDEETIAALAKLRHRRNAVARYIRSQRSGNALNGMHTDTIAATADQVAAWKAAGKPTTEDYKEPTKGGTISLVWRESTKSRPAGWYYIKRRYTVNQWQSIEALTEDGTPAGIIRTQNTYAADLDAVERLEALATAAELTPREREFLAVFCGRAARQAGAEGRAAYHTENGTKATEAGASAAEYAARKAYCFNRIGLTTEAARRQFFSRLTRRLYAAAPTECTVQTPAEYAEKDRRYWERLQTDSRRGTPTTNHRRPDLIAAAMEAAAEITADPIIAWTTYRPILEAAAPCVTGWTERAAKSAAQSAAVFMSRIDNTTAEAEAKAAAAAKAYADKARAEAEERTAKTAAVAKADRLTKATAAAIRAGVYTNATSWEVWQTWTDEQRTIYTEYLNARTA